MKLITFHEYVCSYAVMAIDTVVDEVWHEVSELWPFYSWFLCIWGSKESTKGCYFQFDAEAQ
jgi:hypothetical protein